MLYSYVVDHDDGFAPNPEEGLCTLARCKFGTTRRNIVEMAEIDDWIVGTGGIDLRKSAGHGRLVYAMKVTDKISLAEYFRDYAERFDAKYPCGTRGRYALLSNHHHYFGQNAVMIPSHLLSVEKQSQGYKSRSFTSDFVQQVLDWLSTLPLGKHGDPCQSDAERLVRLACRRSQCKPKRSKARC